MAIRAFNITKPKNENARHQAGHYGFEVRRGLLSLI